MTIEDRLRAAITARTSSVEPSAGALHQIQEKIMDTQRQANRNRLLLGIGAAAAVVALVLAAVVTNDDDGDAELDVAGSSTTTEVTQTTEPSTTSTETTETTFEPTVDPAVAVWPRVQTSQRFDSPDAVARSFVVDFLGFVDPVIGEYQAGDLRSGEVPVQPTAQGPVTTVLVRQLEDDTWFVIGADTADITLGSPEAGADIDCPVQLTGTALAFEGTVNVAIYADLVDEPIGTGFVTGSGSPPAGPFDGAVECDMSSLGAGPSFGVIVLSVASGEDGRIWSAEVVRVQLTEAGEAP